VVTWNINGPGADRAPAIVGYLRTLEPDLIVLTEYRASRASNLIPLLRDAGWKYWLTSTDKDADCDIIVAARTPIVPTERYLSLPPTEALSKSEEYFQKRWLEVRVPAWQVMGTEGCVTIGGVHVPEVGGSGGDEQRQMVARKKIFCDALHAMLQKLTSTAYMLIGDLNTGLDDDIVNLQTNRPTEPKSLSRNSRYVYPLVIERLRDELRFRDAWRVRHRKTYEYTYRGKTNGFRLDQAWLAPALRPALSDATHTRDACEKITIGREVVKRSDHEALVVDLLLEVIQDRAISRQSFGC
jgi:exonuclease III